MAENWTVNEPPLEVMRLSPDGERVRFNSVSVSLAEAVGVCERFLRFAASIARIKELEPSTAEREALERQVYISIGNSDGRLTDVEWEEFYARTDELLTEVGLTTAVHGVWRSLPGAKHVNACWCVEVAPDHVDALKETLRLLADTYRQDSIAYAVANTEFLRATLARERGGNDGQ